MKRLEELLAASRIPFSYEERGKHRAVVISGTRGTRRAFISRTASDHRAAKNAFRDCRKIAREVGYDV